MEARATSRFSRVTAQKARLVVDMIRGQPVEKALGILEYTPKKAARMIAKIVRSAVANAEHGQRVDVDALYVKRVWVDEGPTAKRFTPRAHGRATPVFKRSSHITVVVDERRSGAEA
jgi:large subunit ribosomal protein L22